MTYLEPRKFYDQAIIPKSDPKDWKVRYSYTILIDILTGKLGSEVDAVDYFSLLIEPFIILNGLIIDYNQ